MRLRGDVIKATPNRKCYMWYTKMCMLDSNCWCLNVEIMHSAITCLRWRALMWNPKTVLLKESVIRGHRVFKEMRAPQVGEITLCNSSSLLGICLYDDHRLFCRSLRHLYFSPSGFTLLLFVFFAPIIMHPI